MIGLTCCNGDDDEMELACSFGLVMNQETVSKGLVELLASDTEIVIVGNHS